MKKKILIGSIVAVIILVLVSFTGVVGYQTSKSSTVAKASPLFNIRTSRAIGEESKDITCRYVGKGNTLLFPERDDKAIMFQKVVDRISKMGNETFDRFIAFVIDSLQKNNRFNGIKPDIIRETLYLFRNSDTLIPIFDADVYNKQYNPKQSAKMQTIPRYCLTFRNGIKGILMCVVVTIFLPFMLIVDILMEIIGLALATTRTCGVCITLLDSPLKS